MQIEAGKFYRTRNGRKIGPIRLNWADREYWQMCSGSMSDAMYYRRDGFSCPGSLSDHNGRDDLIAEWVDEPTVIQIEAGKFYRTRDGRKIGPMKFRKTETWCWFVSDIVKIDGVAALWKDDGRFSPFNGDHVFDLIAEWVEEPTGEPLIFGYTNYRGEYAVRKAIPLRYEYRVSEWHGDQPQHIMVGWDVEKRAERDFLMSHMVPWVGSGQMLELIASMLEHNFRNPQTASTEPKVKPEIGSPDWLDNAERAEWGFMDQVLSDAEAKIAPFHMSAIGVARSIAQARSKEGWRDKNFSRNHTPERVQELLEANNRYLEEMRTARRTAGAALLLAQTWRGNGNELAADILNGVLHGDINPMSDMVKHSAPGAARCIGPIEVGLREIVNTNDASRAREMARSLLEHNFRNPQATSTEPKVEPK